jgi:hypothetical protein
VKVTEQTLDPAVIEAAGKMWDWKPGHKK